jgi:hypothetical protein
MVCDYINMRWNVIEILKNGTNIRATTCRSIIRSGSHSLHWPQTIGHLHKKTPYRLHEFDFEIMYKKGINMPADYLSRYTIAALNERTHQVDPFILDLQALQAKDQDLIKVLYFLSQSQQIKRSKSTHICVLEFDFIHCLWCLLQTTYLTEW